MAKQNRTTLKGYFETGDTPSQAQYADLIDSNMNLIDTGIQIVPGTISSSNIVVNTNITASGNVSASGDLKGFNITASNNIVVAGNITSSGIVSASAGFIGQTLSFLPGMFIRDDSGVSTGAGNIFLSKGTQIQGNITASGNISSSGDVKGLTLTTPGNITGSTIEGQILLADLNITSSGNISASGNIIANSGSFNYIESINRVRHTNDGGTEISFVNDTVIIRANSRETFWGGGNFTRLGNDDTPTRISGSSIMFNSPINSTSNIITTQNIIATGNITSNGTGSFNGGLVLVSPNGDQFVFTVNNSGHLSLTGSAI